MSTEHIYLTSILDREQRKFDATVALVESLRGQIRSGVLDDAQWAGRFYPAQRPEVEAMALSFGDDFDGLREHFAGLPCLLHPVQQGSSYAGPEGTAGEQLEQLAHDLAARDRTLTLSQARLQTYAAYPRLYEQVRDE